MNQRSGATLLEVLVAIFVMGIGLLALLVLFPLGALRMAQAIIDERCAQAASMANAIATFQPPGVRNDPLVLNDPNNDPTVTDPFQDPKWTIPGMKLADPDGPSFPVFVDPPGYFTAFGLNSQYWLSSFPNTIRRRNVSFVGLNKNAALRWFTMLDDVFYDIDGTPKYLGANIQRDIRYSWAYMLKRPKTSVRSVVDMTVVVFNKRTLALSSNLDLNESLYQTTPTGTVNEVYFNPTNNTIKLVPDAGLGNTLPALRPGDWLLDASYVPMPDSNNPPTYPFATVNGYFYRVVGINEILSAATPTVEYEVQPELRNFPATNGPGAWRKVVFLDGVAEVLEKGTGRMP